MGIVPIMAQNSRPEKTQLKAVANSDLAGYCTQMPLTLEQRKIRCRGVTGSQIAVLAGLSPWGSAVDVWREKVNGPDYNQADAPNPHTERGIFFEDACLRWYVHRTHRTIVPTQTIVHPEHPLVIATPDAVSLNPLHGDRRDATNGRINWVDGDIVVEVKCPSWRTAKSWGEEGSDQIPEYYYPQVIWEMAVTGLTHAHVVAYFGDQLRIYNVPWNQAIFDKLREVAEKFWQDNVLPGIPPKPDASSAYTQYLLDSYPKSSLDLADVTGDTEIQQAADKMRQAEAAIKEHTAQLDEAKNIIRQCIGARKGIKGPFGRVTWTNNKDASRIDWEKVAREAGASDDLIQSHTTIRPGPRVLRCNWS